VAPAQLYEAQKALQIANNAHKEHKDEDKVRSLAYVAERKAQLAESRARTELAARQKENAEARWREELAKTQKRTEAELRASRERYEQQQRANESEAEARARREQETLAQLESTQRKLDEQQRQIEAERLQREQQLEAERKAREASEARAQQLAADLERIAKVKQDERGVVLTLSGNLLFASGKDQLLPGAHAKLDQVARALKDSPDAELVVEGHADSQGPEEFNDELSYRRANAVSQYLVTRGVPENRVRAVGYGETRPIADNSSPEGRANNRRVEIVVESPKTGVGGSGQEDATGGSGTAQDESVEP
jgi:outer membrane protein OmpA-like peptidoglycan-associated protein